MNVKKDILLPALLMMLLVCAGCTKNEFYVDVEATPDYASSLRLEYYASDAKKGWLNTYEVRGGMAQHLTLATVQPAVVFITCGGRTLTCFWAERGDKLKLSSQDGFWTATGNATSDELAVWQRQNRNIIQADAALDLNKAVSAYVKANPDKRSTAIILYVYYNSKADVRGFDQLVRMLKGDAASGDVLRALGRVNIAEAPERVNAMRLRARGDTALTVSPAQAKATVYLFWYSTDFHHQGSGTLRRLLRGNANVRVADINMQADTSNWSYTLEADSIRGWSCVWAPGAEQNASLKDLHLLSPDFLMVADGRSRIIYRGTDAEEAAKAALSVR